MNAFRLAIALCTSSIAIACGFSLDNPDLAESTIKQGARVRSADADSGAETDLPSTDDAGTSGSSSADAASGPKGSLKAFISSTLTTGNIGGVTGADALCNDAAKAAGLPGTYTAWISTTAVNAIDRITANGPWELVDGKLVAATKADLTKGSVPQRFKDEKGNIPPTEKDWAWTATGPDGKLKGKDCDGWTSTSGSGRVGEAEQTDARWTSITSDDCSITHRVYCLQQQ